MGEGALYAPELAAVAFKQALSPEFKEYQKQIIANAAAMADEFRKLGFRLVSGGTDTHLMLVDLRPFKLTGKTVEGELGKVDITVNRNTIPYDPEKPFITSGIRIGTPAITTRGMKEDESRQIAQLIHRVVVNIGNEKIYEDVKNKVRELCEQFPLYQYKLKDEYKI